MRRGVVLLVTFMTLLSARAVRGQSLTPGERDSVQRLRWLGGCWQQRSGRRSVEEQWMSPRGGISLGMSRTLQGDSVVAFEHARIFERGDRLVFSALPSGQQPTEFTSIALSDSSVTFENLTHDFPQRVLYRRIGVDSIVARVEGMRRGQLTGINFQYERVRCAPS